MIIGLTGKNGAGKGEVAKVLQETGFSYFSLSDILRESLKQQSKKITRTSLTEFANQLRQEKGAGALAVLLAPRLEPDHNYIVDSIRHPEEVRILKNCPNFFLLAVDAEAKTRFERIKLRSRENDTLTYEEFVAQEAKEAAGKKATDQQLNLTIEMADARIENSGNLEELRAKVIQVLQALSTQTERPGWDSYFMAIAKQVALRSNCVKRRVAAIIVKDQRVISTGYNGMPRGIKNCNEGGCPRCRQFGTSGSNLENCLCSHAEENAIVQSAYHGVALKGATIYTTFSPCLLCTKMIINSGIAEVVYSHSYHLEEVAGGLLREAKIILRQLGSV